MSDRVAAQTQQTADVGRRLEMHAHEMTSRMTFASAKKGALRSVQRAAAKAPRSWRSSTVMVFLSPCTWPAFHRMSHTSSPRPSTPDSSLTSRRELIGDRGYDSDRLDDTLMTTYGIEMIAAHRRGRARTQDGRPLRRVRRRWKVERFFAWLHHSRRAVTRWEYHVDNFLGMIQLACARMLLRAFMR
jgi:transposase